MALQLSVTDKNGVTSEYHRISGMLFDEKAIIRVSSYANEQYRQHEKDQKSIYELLQLKYNQLNAEMYKPDGEKNTELVLSLSAEINEMNENTIDSSDRFIKQAEYTFDYDKSEIQSYEMYYEKLKTLSEFQNAIDV